MEKISFVCHHCLKTNSLPKKDSYNKVNCGHCKSSLLGAQVVELTNTSFDYFIVNNDLPIIVDFWAPWCGPCKMMAPTFSAVASGFDMKVRFAKVNTENEQNISSRFAIRSIPTLIMFKNGQEVDRISGALDATSLKNFVSRHI